MGGRDGGAERTSWTLANSPDVINAAGRTSGNFSFAVEFDVGRQVVGKIDAVAIGQVIFQCELIRGSINLAKVVNAGIGWAGVRSSA